ncbi:hypothetical protein MARCHEWKA_04100 [Brevundimonas phage vB_BpoS-Marchewka]|uniref:Uncharacterized protein n=1 Tax=Brevundimonas phage vB_BpoS-Marchewka TaxID=2948604 RepID=A0A9E7N5H8_9CAUD|nr:hypothetical protein MARCHEWKA_04100 [Brevundimonas phage vB_BpoS-Marchewka]
MAIKDDPDSRLKAADARDLFTAEAREQHHERMDALIARHALKAVGLLLLLEGFTGWRARAEDAEDASVLANYMRGWHGALAPEQRALQGVILLGVRDDGVIDLATWGADAEQCAAVARMAAAHALPAAPFQTWFGWGNGGRAKALTEAELEGLTTFQQGWALTNTHPKAER